MLNIVIFGAPGSGKGTQSERLIDKYNLYHISTGELLRGHISRGTDLGKVADSFISRGQLIPDELMIDVLADELDSNKDKTASGVIFDGFPRTIQQAEALKKMLADRGTKIHAVIGLEVPEEELVDRMLRRGRIEGRADDNIETIKKRLDVYHRQTSPLREYYLSEGKYKPIKGHGSVDDIAKDISDKLDSIPQE